MLSAKALRAPLVTNDRDGTGVVVVVESAVLHCEETSVQENIIAGQRHKSRGVRDKIKDPRSLTVILVAKLDLHFQKLPRVRGVILPFHFSTVVALWHYMGIWRQGLRAQCGALLFRFQGRTSLQGRESVCVHRS